MQVRAISRSRPPTFICSALPSSYPPDANAAGAKLEYMLRPTGVSAPAPDAPLRPCGRPRSPSVRGTRAGACARVCLVDTSASLFQLRSRRARARYRKARWITTARFPFPSKQGLTRKLGNTACAEQRLAPYPETAQRQYPHWPAASIHFKPSLVRVPSAHAGVTIAARAESSSRNVAHRDRYQSIESRRRGNPRSGHF
jgi:hypothetical protein